MDGGCPLLTLILCRALSRINPRNKDLRGLATNVWYGIEEDVYLKASTLGSTVVTMKDFVGGSWHTIG